MFNNRFNSTKKDPLVEAVQSAMQDGEIRRQAVAYVNEAFGVYNRNAVVREDLAEYDAAIEEAYNCMKEGEKKDEKKEDKPKADYSKMREKMVGKGKDLETTRKIVGEGNDGNLANNYPPYDKVTRGDVIAGATGKDQMGGKKKKMEEEQIDEISKKLALKAMKKSDERGEEEYDRDMTDDRLSDPKTHWDRAKRLRGHMKRKFGNKTIKTGGTDNLSPKSYEQGGGERRRADKLKKGPRAGMISARHRDKLKHNIKYSLGKHKKPNLPEETQIDEIKVSTADSYLSKRTEQARKGLLPGDHNPTSKTELKNMRNAAERTDKDYYKKRGFKKMEEGTAEAETSMNVTRDNRPSTPAQTNAATSGPSAADKAALTSKIKTMKEAVYSAKAARAGKDIGKPGKEFKKIAAKAGEKYGSEERGKKVAGAILKRIRAKHMKEENLEELSAFGKAFAAAKGQNFTFGGKQYSGAMKGQTGSSSSSSGPQSNAGLRGATGFPSRNISTSKAEPNPRLGSSSSSGPQDNPGLRGSSMPQTPKAPTPADRWNASKSSAPTSAPAPTGGPARDVGMTGKAGGEKGVTSGSTVSLDRPGNVGASTPSSPPEQSRAAPGTFAARSAAGEMKADAASAGVKKLMSMNESVQVGANRYRIV
jgi:hypothetical protein